MSVVKRGTFEHACNAHPYTQFQPARLLPQLVHHGERGSILGSPRRGFWLNNATKVGLGRGANAGFPPEKLLKVTDARYAIEISLG